MSARDWAEWSEDAPYWAFRFFAGPDVREELEPIAHHHAPVGHLEQLLEHLEDSGTRVTITIEPREEV